MGEGCVYGGAGCPQARLPVSHCLPGVPAPRGPRLGSPQEADKGPESKASRPPTSCSPRSRACAGGGGSWPAAADAGPGVHGLAWMADKTTQIVTYDRLALPAEDVIGDVMVGTGGLRQPWAGRPAAAQRQQVKGKKGRVVKARTQPGPGQGQAGQAGARLPEGHLHLKVRCVSICLSTEWSWLPGRWGAPGRQEGQGASWQGR